jgi:hypothetical protein
MFKNIKTEYVVKSEYKQYRQQKSYEEKIINRCPNKKHKDGRIYCTTNDGKYIAVVVSPYHKDFRTQIEDGVWPIIKSLQDKGYLTVSSCAGHVDPWKEFYFTIAFNTKENAHKFINDAPSEDSIFKEYESLSNISQYGSDEYRHIEDNEKNKFNEVRDMNISLFRNYDNYHYVRVEFNHSKYKLWFNPFNIFGHHSLHKKAIKQFEFWKKNLQEHIETKLNYYDA